MNTLIGKITNLSPARKNRYIRVIACAVVGLGVIWSLTDDANQKRERRRIAEEHYNMIRQSALADQHRAYQKYRQLPPFPGMTLESRFSARAADSSARRRELETLRKQVEEDEQKLDQRISEGGAGIIYQGRISRAKSRIYDLECQD